MEKPGKYDWWQYSELEWRLIAFKPRQANKVNKALGYPYPQDSIKDHDEPIFRIMGTEEDVRSLARKHLGYRA